MVLVTVASVGVMAFSVVLPALPRWSSRVAEAAPRRAAAFRLYAVSYTPAGYMVPKFATTDPYRLREHSARWATLRECQLAVAG
ncbi:hypothetical protein GCM10010507_59330 [Streptomyces cinnamoneus]|uniref:Uncharacterized protein n=1 Tax=Streptomyces cinnamoneus TaxID=53446 RepID=A0A918WRD9_STRCJ|nr:hypothetical protein GCM10010507_59330 [Streptomyces cinnamoneus]